MVMGQQTTFKPDSIKRLAALTVASLLLCLSFVMSFFTSFPVALATVMYGRKKGYGAVALAWALSFVISFFILGDPTMFATYTASVFVTVFSAEVVLRNTRPMRGIVVAGCVLSSLVFGSLFATFSAADLDVKKVLVQEINDKKEQFQAGLEQQKGSSSNEAFQMIALLEQPEVLATQIIKEAPSYILMGVFLTIWANVFLLFKSKRTILGSRLPYNDWDLVNYKNPDQLIWAVIVALALAVFGDQLGEIYPVIGISALKVLGVFYFFQGFGLYIAFLDFMRLRGFLRTILVIATVMTAAQVLALVGLFDMFVNFRRFMRKKD